MLTASLLLQLAALCERPAKMIDHLRRVRKAQADAQQRAAHRHRRWPDRRGPKSALTDLCRQLHGAGCFTDDERNNLALAAADIPSLRLQARAKRVCPLEQLRAAPGL